MEIPTEENLNSVKSLFNRHLHCTLGKDLKVATAHDFYLAFAYTVRDYVMDRWKHTQDIYYSEDPKVGRKGEGKKNNHYENSCSRRGRRRAR